MAYDEALAERVREALATTAGVTEKQMFGGLGFMVDGRMAVAVSGSGGLMVHVDPADRDGLLRQRHVEAMVMGGRTQKRWIRVREQALASEEALADWVRRGVAYTAQA